MDPLLHHYGRSGKFTFLQILIEYLNIMTFYDIFTPQGQITWSIDELCHVPSFFCIICEILIWAQIDRSQTVKRKAI